MNDITTTRRITSVDTHDLRRRVLRDGTPTSDVVLDGDDEPTTIHLGALVGTDLVAVATLLRRPDPDRDDAPSPAYQLRGMATEPTQRSQGVGTLLLTAAISAARAEGAREVWAHARLPALDFYHRLGFLDCGDDYVDPATAIEHRTIRLPLD